MPEQEIIAVARKEFNIILMGEGVGSYQWAADHETLTAFGSNLVRIETVADGRGIGSGSKLIYTFKFDTAFPPLHLFRFTKKRNWEEKIIEAKEVYVTVYPDAGLAAIALAKRIKEYDKKVRDDPNALVKPNYPIRGIFS